MPTLTRELDGEHFIINNALYNKIAHLFTNEGLYWISQASEADVAQLMEMFR
tara:strand:- start:289 stop:444 length:156 start_codon:yes stop_codon:yes gene_type:complete